MKKPKCILWQKFSRTAANACVIYENARKWVREASTQSLAHHHMRHQQWDKLNHSSDARHRMFTTFRWNCWRATDVAKFCVFFLSFFFLLLSILSVIVLIVFGLRRNHWKMKLNKYQTILVFVVVLLMCVSRVYAQCQATALNYLNLVHKLLSTFSQRLLSATNHAKHEHQEPEPQLTSTFCKFVFVKTKKKNHKPNE